MDIAKALITINGTKWSDWILGESEFVYFTLLKRHSFHFIHSNLILFQSPTPVFDLSHW